MSQIYDSIIIGGGAAGLMCAATAGRRGRRVLVIEHANKVGKKILMSGGGRCNFTNLQVEPQHYVCGNRHFCTSALSRYTANDFIALVDSYAIAYHEKTAGQLFCDHSAQDIRNMLLDQCQQGGVTLRTRCEIEQIEKRSPQFVLHTNQGRFHSDTLVVATGGLSIPSMGASDGGHRIARQFGLRCTATAPALVPFVLKERWQRLAATLAGLSLDVVVRCGPREFRDALLFTHRGLSGPAILQISHYWQPGQAVAMNFLPQHDVAALVARWRHEGRRAELKTLLSQHLPKRFVNHWLDASVGRRTLDESSKAALAQVAQSLQHWTIIPPGTEGYRTAEVTRGGVDTAEISSKTFEAKRVPGMYFIGEVLDVSGWLGGYNFQWAWASGYCAAQYI